MSDSRGSWELTKENIQPRASGRSMANLSQALPMRTATGLSDQLQYEQLHLKEIQKMEQEALKKEGDDPLQEWVNLINYFEQHFPNMTQSIKAKYGQLLRVSLKEFYGEKRYSSDERYIRIVIASVKGLPEGQQIKCLTDFLRDGEGEFCSDMYIRLAELYDAGGKTKEASEILKRGIAKNAQPNKGKLEEMLTYIQMCWAENYRKMLQNNGAGDQEESNGRNFASSVPIVGENNEAVSIRQNLEPAAPTNTSRSAPARMSAQQKLSLFNEENCPPQQSVVPKDNPVVQRPDARLESLDRAESDRENRLEAGRWNSKHTELENPVIPEPPEKLKLFVESDTVPTSLSTNKSQTINKRALQERKDESELSEGEALLNFQPPTAMKAPEPAATSQQVDEPIIEQPKESKSEESVAVPKESNFNCNRPASLSWRKNHHKNKGKDNFFENVKYKPLPPGRGVSRLMLQCEKYFEEREKEIKAKKLELENNELTKLHRQLDQLKSTNENLHMEIEHLKTVTSSAQVLEEKLQEARRLNDLKLFEKNERISNLESQNEDLMGQLTRMNTNNNVLESHYQKLKHQLEQKIFELEKNLEEERQRHGEELQFYKHKCDELSRNNHDSLIKRIKQEPPENDYDKARSRSTIEMKKQSFVDIDVRSRTVEIYSSPSTDQGNSGGETSRFQSGETTVEQQEQQSIAASSFMPDLNMNSGEGSAESSPVIAMPPRKVLGMVDRPLESDSLNMTPAAPPPMDFEIPPPNCASLFRKPTRTFALYESFSDSLASKPAAPRQNLGVFGGGGASKRSDFAKKIQSLPENLPPPKAPAPRPQQQQMQAAFNSDENSQMRRSEMVSEHNFRSENEFRRPVLPTTDENVVPTLQKPRRSILLARAPMPGDSDDEDDEIILRRHYQTGMDLNVSNLTSILALGPKPLTNSTPEREKTLRDLPTMTPRNIIAQQDTTEETPASDSHAGIRASRYSILNEPPLNLSTIQETSRENRSRSRSTTGSSSGNTMSATRFGAASSSTHLGFNNLTGRSSSIPPSDGRISHYINNGYYSDTNTMQ